MPREWKARHAAATSEDEKDETHVPAKAGLNRFVWDMRLDPAQTVEGQELRPWEKPIGPVILPGTYSVELKVGERTVSQPFEVVEDPRIDISDKDLREQFDLLLRIRDRCLRRTAQSTACATCASRSRTGRSARRPRRTAMQSARPPRALRTN